MRKDLEPLPLESRRREFDPPPRFRLTAVAAVAHVGLCLSVLSVPIHAASFAGTYVRPVLDQLLVMQRAFSLYGVAAGLGLGVMGIAIILKLPWARRAFAGLAGAMIVIETIRLLCMWLIYAPAFRARAAEQIREIAAATTQPTSQPALFPSFAAYGLYIMPLLTWLVFGGFALWAWMVMRSDEARRGWGR